MMITISATFLIFTSQVFPRTLLDNKLHNVNLPHLPYIINRRLNPLVTEPFHF